MMNATLAFCILALKSSSVPPFLLIVLPRYANDSISSSGSPFKVRQFGEIFFPMSSLWTEELSIVCFPLPYSVSLSHSFSACFNLPETTFYFR